MEGPQLSPGARRVSPAPELCSFPPEWEQGKPQIPQSCPQHRAQPLESRRCWSAGPPQPHRPSTLAAVTPLSSAKKQGEIFSFLCNKQHRPSGLPPGPRAQGEAKLRGPALILHRPCRSTQPGSGCSSALGSATSRRVCGCTNAWKKPAAPRPGWEGARGALGAQSPATGGDELP